MTWLADFLNYLDLKEQVIELYGMGIVIAIFLIEIASRFIEKLKNV